MGKQPVDTRTRAASAGRNGMSKPADEALASRNGAATKSAKRNGAQSAKRNGTASASKSPRRNGAKSAPRNGTGNGALFALMEGLSAPPDEHFYNNLSRNLAVALDARFGFVSEVGEEPGTLQLLALWTGAEFGESIAYATEGTPCERVLMKNLVAIRKGVCKSYPKDEWLREVQAEGYMAAPLLGADGSAIGHIGVIGTSPVESSNENITVLRAFAVRAAGEMQRNIEQRLASQRVSRVEAIVNKAAVGVIQIDSEGKIVFANPRVETLFGYERGELLTQPIEVLVPGKSRTRHKEDRDHYLRNPHDRPMGADLEILGRRKDGSTIPVTVALSADGRAAVAIISDATKARKASQEAEESQARLEAVVEAFPEMIFVMDREGYLLDHVSDGLVSHIPPQEFLGKCITDVVPEEAAGRILRGVKRALKTRIVQRVKYHMTRDDGKHSYESRLVRLDNERVAVFVRDFTVEEWQSDETIRVGTAASPADEIERRMEWRNPYGLSYREFGVLHLLKGGTTDKEIAEDLGISVFTVNKHVSNILTKMNAASRTEATIRALQEGLID